MRIGGSTLGSTLHDNVDKGIKYAMNGIACLLNPGSKGSSNELRRKVEEVTSVAVEMEMKV
jgi:hypothetical protein